MIIEKLAEAAHENAIIKEAVSVQQTRNALARSLKQIRNTKAYITPAVYKKKISEKYDPYDRLLAKLVWKSSPKGPSFFTGIDNTLSRVNTSAEAARQLSPKAMLRPDKYMRSVFRKDMARGSNISI